MDCSFRACFAGIATFALAMVALPTASSANLIANGDFEAGNTGFSSDYTHSPTNITGAATYAIVTDPSSVHGSAASYGDHTSGSGNMMAVNGSTVAGDLVWGETISVQANATYDFAVYISSWFSGAPASLVFTVNGTTIGSLVAPMQTGAWELAFATWNSGSETSALIEVRNDQTAFGGNDFALDDFYFGNPIFSASVAEPSMLGLFGLAGLGLAVRRRRTAASGA